MKNVITKSESSQPVGETAVYLFDDWFDPIEAGVRDRVRGFIQAMIEGELDETLMRPRYGRRLASSSGKDDGLAAITGHRHGHRLRSLTGSFGRTEEEAPGVARGVGSRSPCGICRRASRCDESCDITVRSTKTRNAALSVRTRWRPGPW